MSGHFMSFEKTNKQTQFQVLALQSEVHFKLFLHDLSLVLGGLENRLSQLESQVGKFFLMPCKSFVLMILQT